MTTPEERMESEREPAVIPPGGDLHGMAGAAMRLRLWAAVTALLMASAWAEPGERGDARILRVGPVRVPERALAGTPTPAIPALARQRPAYVRPGDVYRMTVGAYDICQKCTGYWVGGVLLRPPTGRTAMGPRPRGNHTASCPPEFPLGTWVEISIRDFWPLGQRRRCEDRGDAIRMRPDRSHGRPVGKLEVYVEGSHQDALAFAGGRGVVAARVEVIGPMTTFRRCPS